MGLGLFARLFRVDPRRLGGFSILAVAAKRTFRFTTASDCHNFHTAVYERACFDQIIILGGHQHVAAEVREEVRIIVVADARYIYCKRWKNFRQQGVVFIS